MACFSLTVDEVFYLILYIFTCLYIFNVHSNNNTLTYKSIIVYFNLLRQSNYHTLYFLNIITVLHISRNHIKQNCFTMSHTTQIVTVCSFGCTLKAIRFAPLCQNFSQVIFYQNQDLSYFITIILYHSLTSRPLDGEV